MGEMKTYTMFTVVNQKFDRGGPFPLCFYARNVRERMGKLYHTKDWLKGWEKAKAKGNRVQKVKVTIEPA